MKQKEGEYDGISIYVNNFELRKDERNEGHEDQGEQN
jgi:hypothetical protein